MSDSNELPPSKGIPLISKPQVFFGPEIWQLQDQGGVSRYFGELIRNLARTNSEIYALLPESNNTYVRFIPSENRITLEKWNEKSIISQSKNYGAKSDLNRIYHATYFGNISLTRLEKARFKTVITVFDLISEKFPDKKKFKRPRVDVKKKAIRDAQHIICISQTTKNDLLQFYDIPVEKVSVVYLGSSIQASQTPPIVKKLIDPYFLYVGKRRGYKNFDFLLKAFANSDLLKENFHLIAFGGENFNKSELETINSLGIGKNVSHLFGDDALLSKLYGEAHALIYPSLYEGFGLPPIEAMKLGCLVIASNKGSIPEICRDAALYFDPNDLEDLVDTIEKTICNSELNQEKIKSGLLLSAKYTWEQTALQTQQIYANISTQI